MSSDLENIAIREAFKWSASYQDDRSLLAKRYFDHHTISAEDYSMALRRSYYNGGETKELFYWLLERADCQDLKTVKEIYIIYPEWGGKFQDAIKKALKKVGVDDRIGIRERRAAIKGIASEHFPTDLAGLIAEY